MKLIAKDYEQSPGNVCKRVGCFRRRMSRKKIFSENSALRSLARKTQWLPGKGTFAYWGGRVGCIHWLFLGRAWICISYRAEVHLYTGEGGLYTCLLFWLGLQSRLRLSGAFGTLGTVNYVNFSLLELSCFCYTSKPVLYTFLACSGFP